MFWSQESCEIMDLVTSLLAAHVYSERNIRFRYGLRRPLFKGNIPVCIMCGQGNQKQKN